MAIRIANAPCSWGVMGGFDASQFPVPQRVLEEIAGSGYEGTELGDWGYLPTDPATLSSRLAAKHLALVGALVPLDLADPRNHGAGTVVALRTARLLAACAADADPGPFVVLADANGANRGRVANSGRVTAKQGFTDAQWEAFAHGTNSIARAVRDQTGLRTVFHHHCGGFIETPAETERLMEMTEPDLVGLCFDTGHYAYGGGDVIEGFRRFKERIWHVHFKDCHPAIVARAHAEQWDYFTAVTNGVFYGLGGGAVDFAALVAEMEQHKYEGWIVVEDELAPGMGDALESAKRDRSFMKALGL